MTTGTIKLIKTSMFVTALCSPLLTLPEQVPQRHDDGATDRHVARLFGKQPLSFEVNEGQSDSRINFISHGSRSTIFLSPTEATFVLRSGETNSAAKPAAAAKARRSEVSSSRSEKIVMKLVDARPTAKALALDPLRGKINYLIGTDSKKWHTNIPTYAKVRYESVYRGIDLVYYGNQQQLEFDFVVAPAADPTTIKLQFEGARELEVDAQGNLIIQTGGGQKLVQQKPLIYQEINGVRKEIAGGYALTNHQQVGFQIAAYDRAKPLVIDPTLSYSTFLGGSDSETAHGITVDADGNVYIVGGTAYTDFPLRNPIYTGIAGIGEAFVVKLDATGALVYSTFLGGSYGGGTVAQSVAVDALGNLYLAGQTSTLDYPATTILPAGATPIIANADVILVKLNSAGSQVIYSTRIVGSGDDQGMSIALDNSGNAYITGRTTSSDFPTVHALQAVYGGTGPLFGGDAFVAKLNAAGSALIYSTYLGGSDDEDNASLNKYSSAIAVDGQGNAYVTGSTSSTDFPTTANAFQPQHGPLPPPTDVGDQADAFLTKISPIGDLLYSTYLGGSEGDTGTGVAVDADNNVFVSGQTYSCDFPFQKQAVDPGPLGEGVFVVKFSADGSRLLFSTFVCGQTVGNGAALALDSTGHAYITGRIAPGTGFTPVCASGIQPVHAVTVAGGGPYSGFDAFVAKLAPDGSSFDYATYLGGTDRDEGTAIAIDSAGNAYVAGITSSPDFPSPNGFQQTYGGGEQDAFVAKIAASPPCAVGATFGAFTSWAPCPPPPPPPPPTITCPADVVTTTLPGQCSVVLNYAAPAVSGCDGPLVACLPPSGSAFSIGNTIVGCTATCLSGQAQCSFRVTVNHAGVTTPSQGPRIDLVTPESAKIGATVTISGANFSANASDNIVYFGAVRALVTSASATSLTAVVPTGATYAPITVTVGGLTAYGNAPFVVTFDSSGVIDQNSFATRLDFPAELIDNPDGYNSGAVVIADIDGDGRADVIVANRTSHSISVFRNTSTGPGNISFERVDFFTPINLDGPRSLAIGDLDGDGRLDVATYARDGTMCIFRNTGANGVALDSPVVLTVGCGSDGVNCIAIRDLDGDGKPEIVIASIVFNCDSVFVLRNTSTVGSITANSFQPFSFNAGSVNTEVVIADFDGDGMPDIALGCDQCSSVSLLRNLSIVGCIAFEDVVDMSFDGQLGSLALSDLNGDGQLELTIGKNQGRGGNLTVFQWDGTTTDFDVGSFSQIAIADLDGDGKPDIAGVPDGSVLQNQTPAGSDITQIAFPNSIDFGGSIGFNTATSITIGDLDGDGVPDLVVGHVNGGILSVFRNSVSDIVNISATQSKTANAGETVTASTAPTIAGQGGASATFDNSSGSQAATLTVATLIQNPASGTAFAGGGTFVDLKIPGATANSSATANFYYASTLTGLAEANLTLLYFTSANGWQTVLSSGGIAPAQSTTDNLDNTVSGGRFTVTFDSTSTPKITELTGTAFGVVVQTTLPSLSCPGDRVLSTAPGLATATFDYIPLVSTSDSGVTIKCASGGGLMPNCTFGNLPLVFLKGVNTVTCVATRPSPGIITTIAGTGTAGAGGDSGAGTGAQLSYPGGLAMDSSGNIYIADSGNHRIRRWDAASGILTTVAGTGTGGFNGDGVPAASAKLNSPYAVALDSHDNIYIADQTNFRIRKVDRASGIISTVAGTGVAGFSTDGGLATSSQIPAPGGVAVDRNGNLFFSESYVLTRVRRVDAASGIITTVAGTGGYGGFSGDGGPATSAALNQPEALTVDNVGNLFIADVANNRIRRVDAASSIITTVAGTGVAQFSGDGGPAANANLAHPQGITLDAAGNLFIADSNNGLIRRVDAASGIISTVAGGSFLHCVDPDCIPVFGFAGDGAAASTAAFNSPSGLTVDNSGKLFIADTVNQRIRRVDIPASFSASCTFTVTVKDVENPTIQCPVDLLLQTAPGLPSAVGYYPLPSASDNCPDVVTTCIPPPGSAFPVGITTVNCIAMDAAGGIVTTVAGNGLRAYGGDGGLATQASISRTYNPIAVDSAGNVFIADPENQRVRRVDVTTGIITTIAGTGVAGFSGDSGPATAARLNFPTSVAVDAAGNVFIGGGNRIRRVDASSHIITTVAGTGQFMSSYSGDGGPATAATLYGPDGLAFDAAGNLLIADSFFCVVRRVDAHSGTITTVAGNGTRGFGGDNGQSTSAKLDSPYGIAIDPAGNLFINDQGNLRIRRVDVASGIIKTVAGKGQGVVDTCRDDGTAAVNAVLASPLGNPAVDTFGNVFFAESAVIRRVDSFSGILTTVAGTHLGSASTGFNGDGGPADRIQINTVGGLAFDSAGDLYIGDTLNFRIRRVTFAGAAAGNTASCSFRVAVAGLPVITSLSPASMAAGGGNFTLTVNGADFVTNAFILWNGDRRPLRSGAGSTFLGTSQLTALIDASDIDVSVIPPGSDFTTAEITVLNPDGTLSNPMLFTITGNNVGSAQSVVAGAGQSVTVATPNLSTPLDQPGEAAVAAMVNNAGAADPIAVTTATYTGNPTASTIIDAGGGYVDVKVVGADVNDSMGGSFYYPSTVTGAAEGSVTLLYFSGTIWRSVISSGGVPPVKNTSDNLDGTVSGGRFTVTFDNTSTPKITELSGTVFSASVPDTIPPVIHCPANIVANTGPGQCSAAVNYPVTATDNSGGATVVCTPASGASFPKGTTTVSCTASDGSGNHASCSFTVTINDIVPPAITCPANITVGCSVNLLAPVTFAATATDNCNPAPSVTCSPPSGSGFPVGTTTVTCGATDGSGNHSSCQFTITRPALAFTGFLAPVGGADATGGSFASPVGTFKSKSTIPVKFTATCGGAAVQSGIHRLQVIKYSNATTSGDPIDATPQDSATSGDQFQLTGSEWHFNLDTKATGMGVGIWQLLATLSDGTQHHAWIQIK